MVECSDEESEGSDESSECSDELLEFSDEVSVAYFDNGLGDTALTYAFMCLYQKSNSKKEEKIRRLLENPYIDVNEEGGRGFTALLHACDNPPTPRNKRLLKMLLDHPDIDVNMIFDSEGDTHLMLLVRESTHHWKIFLILLEHPDIDINLQKYI